MPEKPYWENKHYAFFTNEKCEYFPCHKSPEKSAFNCLFCYCPLYALGDKCGGNFAYAENGIKDCSGCSLPHIKDNYGYIMEKFEEIAELAKKKGE